MKIGVIADDFTGATDAASFIVAGGLSAIQVNGVPNSVGKPAKSVSQETLAEEYQQTQAIVVALKSRSCPVEQAINESLQACRWLKDQGCELIYFKYCSTFDSTEKGNIGPVTDALMQELGCQQTLVCPALPVNGRRVYMGHLFVYHQLLSESGMRNHPITPMTDPNLVRLMENQSCGRAGLLTRMDYGSKEQAWQKLNTLKLPYIVCDAIDDEDLALLGQLSLNYALVTGGSGLVGAIAAAIAQQQQHAESVPYCPATGIRGLVISGSCSEMTNKQVAKYRELAPAFKLNVAECIDSVNYIEQVEQWVLDTVVKNPDAQWFPLVYATVLPDELQQIQTKYGTQASIAVEALFAQLIKRLRQHDFKAIISAGGETSGTVVQSLGAESFAIGQSISPGVPWVRSLKDQTALALKSGNFGDERFFFQAQEMMQ